MKKEFLNKYLPIIIIFALIVVSFLIAKDFLIPLISAFIFAFLSRPLYLWLNKKLPKSISAIICILIVTSIILIPLIFIIINIIEQISTYLTSEMAVSAIKKMSKIKILDVLGINLGSIREKAIQIMINFLTTITTAIPQTIFAIFIFFIGMYYSLIEWTNLVKRVKKYIPSKNKNKVLKETATITKNVIYGTLSIAIIQFIISFIGFWILGIKFSIVLAGLIGLFSFLPSIGPAVIWIPLLIITLIQKNYFISAGVIIIGLILSIYIDTILRAKISGKNTSTHPIVMIVGIMGGLSTFGIIGFVLGPLILSYTIKLVEELTDD